MKTSRNMIPGFPARLRELRAKRGLSIPELADLTGCHLGTIDQLEAGSRAPSLHMGVALAKALGCTIEDLIAEVPVK